MVPSDISTAPKPNSAARVEDAAVFLDDRRLQQGAAGISQYVVLMSRASFSSRMESGMRAEVPKPNFQWSM
jgi:hypothetical protein